MAYDIFDLGLSLHMNRDPLVTAFNVPNTAEPVGATALTVPYSVTPEKVSSGEQPNVIYIAKQSFTDTTAGMITGIDTDGEFKWLLGDSSGQIDWNVTTADTLTVTGSLSVKSLDIPDTTTVNSFHVDSNGNAWWGATTLGAAVASITNAGVATFTNAEVTGYMKLLGEVTLSGNATVMTISGIDAFDFGELYIYGEHTGTSNQPLQIVFNEDTGTNYDYRIGNNSAFSTATGQNEMELASGLITGQSAKFLTKVSILNFASGHKLVTAITCNRTTGGAPDYGECVGSWNNTSDNITRIDVQVANGLTILSGSRMFLFGRKQ